MRLLAGQAARRVEAAVASCRMVASALAMGGVRRFSSAPSGRPGAQRAATRSPRTGGTPSATCAPGQGAARWEVRPRSPVSPHIRVGGQAGPRECQQSPRSKVLTPRVVPTRQISKGSAASGGRHDTPIGQKSRPVGHTGVLSAPPQRPAPVVMPPTMQSRNGHAATVAIQQPTWTLTVPSPCPPGSPPPGSPVLSACSPPGSVSLCIAGSPPGSLSLGIAGGRLATGVSGAAQGGSPSTLSPAPQDANLEAEVSEAHKDFAKLRSSIKEQLAAWSQLENRVTDMCTKFPPSRLCIRDVLIDDRGSKPEKPCNLDFQALVDKLQVQSEELSRLAEKHAF